MKEKLNVNSLFEEEISDQNIQIRKWFNLPQNLKKFIWESDVNYHYKLQTDFDKWVYACYLNKKLIGYAYVECDYPKHLYILEFEMKESQRKKGYGTHFFQKIKEEYPNIDLSSGKSSLKFWRKNKLKVRQ